jgi:transcriptional regulator with XRE-family HTH domain
MMAGAKRKLYARPTKVTETTVRTVLTVDRLALRVQLRAAELGLTQSDVARRMGVTLARLVNMVGNHTVTWRAFERVSKALELDPGDGWWETPLRRPPPPISAKRVQRELRNKMR